MVGPFGAGWEIDRAEWTQAVEVNLMAPFLLTRVVLPAMRENNWGRIINISSGAAVNPMARAGAYSPTKAALDMMSHQLGVELAGSAIAVISLYPGGVDTRMQEGIRNQPVEKVGQAMSDRFKENHANGALSSPEPVGKIVAALAGEAGETFGGQVIDITDPAVQALLQEKLMKHEVVERNLL